MDASLLLDGVRQGRTDVMGEGLIGKGWWVVVVGVVVVDWMGTLRRVRDEDRWGMRTGGG